jgi:DNA adenine methylase
MPVIQPNNSFGVTSGQNHNAAPFLKWAGGKGQLLKQYEKFIPNRDRIGRYFEPFIGSAALFFYLQPPQATLCDINHKLIDVYRVVQQDVENLIEALKVHKNNKTHYYRVRKMKPEKLTPVKQAARLIFLNKTCYNGLYRENSRGEFNVPFGRYKNPTICDEDRLRNASCALQGVELRDVDFEEAVEPARAGDFIYFDPPYVPLTATSSFTSYNKYGFSHEDQVRLAETFRRLDRRGCYVMLSNSSAPVVYNLYEGYKITKIKARRSINSKADGRGPVTELLITNGNWRKILGR